jgi:hypothetical protein
MSVEIVKRAATNLAAEMLSGIRQAEKGTPGTVGQYGPLPRTISDLVFEKVWYPWMESWQSGYVQDKKDSSKTTNNGLTLNILGTYTTWSVLSSILSTQAPLQALESTGWRNNPTYSKEVFSILAGDMRLSQFYAWAYYSYSGEKYAEIATADPWLAIHLFSTGWLGGSVSNSYLQTINPLLPGPGPTLADKVSASTQNFSIIPTVKLSATLFAARANYIASQTTTNNELRNAYVKQFVTGENKKDSILDLLARCESALTELIINTPSSINIDIANKAAYANHIAALYSQYEATTFSFTV